MKHKALKIPADAYELLDKIKEKEIEETDDIGKKIMLECMGKGAFVGYLIKKMAMKKQQNSEL